MKSLVSQFRLATLLVILSFSLSALAVNPIVVQVIDINGSGYIQSVSWSSGTGNAGTAQGVKAYIGGLFDTVETYYVDNISHQPLVWRTINNASGAFRPVYGVPYPSGLTANNVFELVYTASGDYFTAYALTAGYGGNGVNGEVWALALSSVGDLYVGGQFTAAGGFPYSSGIGVYLASGGWQSSYIFSAFDVVTSFTWVSSTELEVVGSLGTKKLWQVDGPIYSFDHNSDHINVSNNTAFWHTYSTGAFNGGYWTGTQ